MRVCTAGLRSCCFLLGAAFSFSAASAAELQEPPALQSQNGVLDILMVAKAAAIRSLAPLNPTGWVYDICLNPHNGSNDCPATSANLYGGTRLQLYQGDKLKIHLVNKLPPITDSDHAMDSHEAFLALNPTNIHTHGMLVLPHGPNANGAYGDNVFVLTFNPHNGTPDAAAYTHGDVKFGSTDYEIDIPAHHPSGLFWFHPHAHGIALNQVSAGMAGIITIGDVGDYVCTEPGCRSFSGTIGVRHIILKDAQVLADGMLLDQEDPDFCKPESETAGEGGSCPFGGDETDGGRWFFTLNGQQFPDIPIKTPGGEIWRITNASGSATYDLRLWNPAQAKDMIFQVLALDGVSISPAAGASQKDIAQAAGNRLRPVPCPGVPPAGAGPGQPLCTTRLHMMPASRAEIWVAYRNANGLFAAPPPGAKAIFRTAGFLTGPDADDWPAVDLGTVLFQATGSASHAPPALTVRGGASSRILAHRIASDLAAANAAAASSSECKPLAKNHKRRIFFNAPNDQFGLGYEEVDERGVPVPGTFVDVRPFDPAKPTVCLPLGPHNRPVMEQWELVNLSSEDHNFHIHQVRFRILSSAEIDGTGVPVRGAGNGVLPDGVPLLHAEGGGCASVEDWRKGLCTAHTATVEIPFAIAGDFVYHCHILEHEDGGMMAKIRVTPNSQ